MTRLPRKLCGLGLAATLAALIVLAQPSPPQARANPACDVGSAPAGVITGGIGAITGGAIGGGNPVGDACNTVTDGAVGAITDPIGGALEGLGNSIFEQITAWASDGASWLIGRVVKAIEETTTPKLTTKGFLSVYGQMALIAVLLASAMLLAAVIEGIAQGNMGMLVRVAFVNLPLAFIATSAAYVVVQMLLVGTDGLCHAIGAASQDSSHQFFKGALDGLGKAGGQAGAVMGAAGPQGAGGGKAAGETAVPLFVGFLAAIIGAFAAFFVWIELLMRDAAVYVVALFMPLALAASIWPRWSGALRRSAELVVVVICSKFVIVSIIALAAGLVAERGGGVEHILAASALMLLACFSPFALFRLVPFAEGAMAAAYGRRHAGSSTIGTARSVSSAAQTMRRTASSSWGNGGTPGGGVKAGAQGRPGGASRGGAVGGGSKGAAGAGGAAAPAAAGAGLAAAGSLPIAAARGARAGAERLERSAVVEASGGGEKGSPSPSPPERTKPEAQKGGGQGSAVRPSADRVSRPPGDRGSTQGAPGGVAPPGSDQGPARPAPDPPEGGRGSEKR